MVKKILFILALISIQFILSCDNIFTIVYPEFSDNTNLINAKKIPENTKMLIEGIYRSEDKQSKMGEQIVLKFNEDKLSVFCSKSMDFFIMESGVIDSGIVFEGWGRDLETTSVSLGRIFINLKNGADSLLNGVLPDSLKLEFSLISENNSNAPQNNSNLFSYNYKYVRELNKERNFHIIAHRAGARNSDLFSASENSLAMINFAESLGANGIEIDIRLTLDKVPILFHDDFLSNRLVDGDILLGSVENYTLKHLKSFCRLKNGETIPTLEEALNETVINTKLNLVWLDIKAPEVVEYAIPIIKRFEEIAIKNNRNIKFLIGITSEDVYNLIRDNSNNIATICELDKQIAISAKSNFWAPQWTLGYMNSDIEELEKSEIKSLVWTLDDRRFIIEFLENSNYHGILSNYSPIVAYEYYIRN